MTADMAANLVERRSSLLIYVPWEELLVATRFKDIGGMSSNVKGVVELFKSFSAFARGVLGMWDGKNV